MLDKVRLAESRTHKIKLEGIAKAVAIEQGKGKKWKKDTCEHKPQSNLSQDRNKTKTTSFSQQKLESGTRILKRVVYPKEQRRRT